MSTESTRFKFTETLRFRVPQRLHSEIVKHARRTHRKPSEVARQAVVEWLERNDESERMGRALGLGSATGANAR